MSTGIFMGIIKELLPGVVGIIVNRIMTGNLSKENLKTTTSEFLLYTMSAWTLYSILMLIFTFFETNIIEEIKFIFLILISILNSVFWELKAKILFEKIINKVLKKFKRNTISLKNFPSERFFSDNNDHYLGIYKENNLIAIGFLEDWDIATNSVSLLPPKIDEHVKITKLKRSIILINYNIKIDEYEHEIH